MQQHHPAPAAYGRLAVMAALSFAAMCGLMYAMVDRLAHAHRSLNRPTWPG